MSGPETSGIIIIIKGVKISESSGQCRKSLVVYGSCRELCREIWDLNIGIEYGNSLRYMVIEIYWLCAGI